MAQYANHPDAKALIAKLQAILNGDRNPVLADDPALSQAFLDAAADAVLPHAVNRSGSQPEPSPA